MKLKDAIMQYNKVTYCCERRDEDGTLISLACQEFDCIKIDKITRFLLLSNTNTPEYISMFNPDLDCKLIKADVDEIHIDINRGDEEKHFFLINL